MSAGRYKVVDQPLALPGKCYLTGAAGAASGPYIDTSQDIRGYGAVYFSAQAIEEMYRELMAYRGIDITRSLSDEEKAESYKNGFFDGQAAGVENTLENLQEDIYNDLARVVSNRLAGLDPFASAPDEPEDVPEDTGESEGSESGTDGTSEGDSATPGSAGRSRVSKRTSNVDAPDPDADLGIVI